MARPLVVEITSRLQNPQGFDRIDDMQRRMKSFRPIFNDIRSDLEKEWSNNFKTEGGNYGGWKPLSPKYAAWRGSAGPILIRSGQLFNSVRSLHGAPNDIKDDEAYFGTNIEYAKFHQYGTTKMPKRPIIFEPSNVANKWGKWAVKYIADGETFGIKG
jgi:phage gpG-like protein